MNLNVRIVSLILGLSISGSVLAAGIVDSISGDVNVINYLGELRATHHGDAIEAGDTIITSQNGEMVMTADDNALLAIRPNTMLKIEEYRAEGLATDNIVLKLLRGSFRSTAGWVAKSNPKKYLVKTATATITANNADHEPYVIDEGENAGTYDKVNSGSATIDTLFGKTDIESNQVGFVPKSAESAPSILPAPPDIYKLSEHEKNIETRKLELEASLASHLKKQIDANKSAGGGGTRPVKIGSLEDKREASFALDELFRAYETGNTNFIRNRLDPSMIGYQRLIDNIVVENNQCKQMRVNLLDTQLQAGPDLAVVQTNWEKRCLQLPNYTQRFEQGHSTFLMHKGRNGWYMAALSLDNPFAVLSNSVPTLATLNVTSAISCATVNDSGGVLPFNITVSDPDLISQNVVNVFITTSGGDSETVTLNKTGSGVFSRNSFFFIEGPSIPSNNELSVKFGTPVCDTLSVRYTDPTTPSGPQIITRTVTFP